MQVFAGCMVCPTNLDMCLQPLSSCVCRRPDVVKPRCKAALGRGQRKRHLDTLALHRQDDHHCVVTRLACCVFGLHGGHAVVKLLQAVKHEPRSQGSSGATQGRQRWSERQVRSEPRGNHVEDVGTCREVGGFGRTGRKHMGDRLHQPQGARVAPARALVDRVAAVEHAAQHGGQRRGMELLHCGQHLGQQGGQLLHHSGHGRPKAQHAGLGTHAQHGSCQRQQVGLGLQEGRRGGGEAKQGGALFGRGGDLWRVLCALLVDVQCAIDQCVYSVK